MTVSFPLVAAAAEKRNMNRIRRLTWWGLSGFFWLIAVILLFTPSRLGIAYRVGILVAFVATPGVVYVVFRMASKLPLGPARVPSQLELWEDRVEVRYEIGPPVRVEWRAPDARLTVLECAYPGKETQSWLFLGAMSMDDALRIDSGTQDAVGRLAERQGLTKSVDARDLRWPNRRLTWTVFSRAGATGGFARIS